MDFGKTLFTQACGTLRSKGYNVEPSEKVGFTLVDGKEFTMLQVIDFAEKLIADE